MTMCRDTLYSTMLLYYVILWQQKAFFHILFSQPDLGKYLKAISADIKFGTGNTRIQRTTWETLIMLRSLFSELDHQVGTEQSASKAS